MCFVLRHAHKSMLKIARLFFAASFLVGTTKLDQLSSKLPHCFRSFANTGRTRCLAIGRPVQ
jgi:hypothetical protein